MKKRNSILLADQLLQDGFIVTNYKCLTDFINIQ